MDQKTFDAIFQLAKPYLLEGKPENLMHAESVAEIVKFLADSEEQLDFLIPFALLHDTGNSIVLPEDLHYIQGKTIVENGKLFHGLAGAKIASKILTNIDYDKEIIRDLIDLIKIHDFDDISLFKKRTWQIARDADNLDKLNLERLKLMMKTRNKTAEEIFSLIKGHDYLFFTEKALAEFNILQEKFFLEFNLDRKLKINAKMMMLEE